MHSFSQSIQYDSNGQFSKIWLILSETVWIHKKVSVNRVCRLDSYNSLYVGLANVYLSVCKGVQHSSSP